MSVTIRAVRGRKDLRTFIHLPARLHRGHTNWVPPVYMDEYSFFNQRKNHSFSYCDSILALAFRNGKAVGRIMGLINRRYNEKHNEPHARFSFMECPDDQEAAHGLIRFMEDWAKAKGMKKMVGPLGFSDKDPQGFQIAGFEYPPILATPCNHPYMPGLIENEGYVKKVDLRDFLFEVPDKIPLIYEKIGMRFSHRADFKVIEFNSRHQLKPYIYKVFELMNHTYTNIYGFVPLNKEEMDELAKRYLPAIDPAFVKIVIIADEMVGFVIGLPELSRGIQRSRGYLLPFGWWYILREMKHSRQLTLLLGAVKPAYRGMGIDAVMGIKMLETCLRRKINHIETHLILETNLKMIAEVEKLGAREHKRFRIYEREI